MDKLEKQRQFEIAEKLVQISHDLTELVVEKPISYLVSGMLGGCVIIINRVVREIKEGLLNRVVREIKEGLPNDKKKENDTGERDDKGV